MRPGPVGHGSVAAVQVVPAGERQMAPLLPALQAGSGSAPPESGAGPEASSQAVTPLASQVPLPTSMTLQIDSTRIEPPALGRSTSVKVAPASVDLNRPTLVPASSSWPRRPSVRTSPT